VPLALGAGAACGGGVVLTNSADFEEANNEYFTFTPSGAGDDIKKGTVAFWMKREEVTTDHAYIFTAREDIDNLDRSYLRFDNADILLMRNVEVSRSSENQTPLAYAQTDFHHWVHAWDTTLATAGDRLRLWRNGTEITLNATQDGHPLQNEGTWYGTANLHLIGRRYDADSNQFDGLLSDFHFIDGLAKEPADFVTFDGSNFTILNYAGSYGTNGCRLRFDNASDLGEDSSGNNNDWANINTVTQSSVVPTSPVS